MWVTYLYFTAVLNTLALSLDRLTSMLLNFEKVIEVLQDKADCKINYLEFSLKSEGGKTKKKKETKHTPNKNKKLTRKETNR